MMSKKSWPISESWIMEIESEGLEYAYKKGKISELEYNLYQRYIKGLERRINVALFLVFLMPSLSLCVVFVDSYTWF